MQSVKDLEQKQKTYKARVAEAVNAGEPMFADEWSDGGLSEQAPLLLTAFFFQVSGYRPAYSSADLQACRDYIGRVLNLRQAHLQRALSLHRAAAARNDHEATARYELLCQSLGSIVRVHREMDKEILDTLTGAADMWAASAHLPVLYR